MSKNTENTSKNKFDLGTLYVKAEDYINKNKKTLIYAIIGVTVVVGGILYYNLGIVAPKNRQAAEEMFKAEYYFALDSFQVALDGQAGQFPGFLEIIDEYKGTKSANLAKYYAGISYLHLGKYEEAIEYLKGFKTNDEFLQPISIGAMGDAYRELGNSKEAASYYEKAANVKKNDLTTPLYLKKAAQVFEVELAQPKKALELYKRIQHEYYNTAEGREIDKNVTKLEAMLAE